MSSDQNTISEKIIKLYDQMEYQSDPNTEQVLNDFKNEMTKEMSCNFGLSEIGDDYSLWMLRMRDLFERQRSIFTKLFSLTNHPNGVDLLIEYCDYYRLYLFKPEYRYISGVYTENDVSDVLQSTFVIMARNETTEGVLSDVLNMLDDMFENVYQSKGDHFVLETVFREWTTFRPLEMVIMADSDLHAAVQAFIRSRHTYFKVTRILVQESIKEQLLKTITNEEYKNEILSHLFVFRTTEEALANLNGENKVKAISIWSENIIAAKKFSAKAETNTIWINALGLIDFGLHSIYKKIPFIYADDPFWDCSLESSNLNNESLGTPIKAAKKYDLFYGGKWQSPANVKYWTNQAGDSFAQATKDDFRNCANAARGAFKLWRSTKLSQRVEIIKCFGERLRANGESEYADIVLQCLDRPLEYGTLLSIVRDGEAEILTTPEPVGVVAIISSDQKMLFAKLTIASLTGNAVVVLLRNGSSVSFAQYCDLLGSCGFPPGVINCVFGAEAHINRHIEVFDEILPEFTESLDIRLVNLYKRRPTGNIYDNFFIIVTRPKSVWISIQ